MTRQEIRPPNTTGVSVSSLRGLACFLVAVGLLAGSYVAGQTSAPVTTAPSTQATSQLTPQAAASQPDSAPATQPVSQRIWGLPVPETIISELRTLLAVPDTEPPAPETTRKCRSVLTMGTQAQREYPDAENLHVVHGMMLTAAQRLASLDSDKDAPKRIVDIAKRIVASNAPPESKAAADFLLTGADISASDDDPAQVAAKIDQFLSRYAATARSTSLIYATMLAIQNDQSRMAGKLADELASKHIDEPGVRGFLRGRLGRRTDKGRSIHAELPRLDGGTLVLPRDMSGKIVLLHFWTINATSAKADAAELLAFYTKYKPLGFEIVSISMDRSRSEVEQFVKNNGMAWTQIFSGQGRDDPFAKDFGVTTLPYYWLNGPDGRGIGNDFYDYGPGQSWPPYTEGLMRNQQPKRRMLQFHASGTFLVCAPLGQPAQIEGGVPKTILEAMEDQVVWPENPADDAARIKQYQAMLDLGEQAIGKYPTATNLYLVRNRMLSAAAGLSLLKEDEPSRKRVAELAQAVLDSKPPADAKLLPEFLLLQQKITSGAISGDQARKAIGAFIAAYENSPLAPSSLICASMLALPAGLDDMREGPASALDKKYIDTPYVRGFMRCILGRHPDQGKPFKAELTKLDGSKLKLPDDLLGKVVIVCFRTAASKKDLPDVALMRSHKYVEGEVAIVCINLDAQKPSDDKAYGLPVINTWSGLGRHDLTAEVYGARFLPVVWAIGRDGVVFADEYYGDIPWAMQQLLTKRPPSTRVPTTSDSR